MKRSVGVLIALNRTGILLLGAMLSLAVFGFVTLRSSAQSDSTGGPDSISGSTAKTGELTQIPSYPDYNGPAAPAATGCGLLIGSGLTTGFPGSNFGNIAKNTVNHAFNNSVFPRPSDVAIFQTHNPWNGTVVKDAVTATGHTATVFTLAQLAGFPFGNYRVVVINLSDTLVADFTPPYTDAIPALENYINNGGVVWIEGAIQNTVAPPPPGGGDRSIQFVLPQSYPMPFGGQANFDTSNSDNIVDAASPMMIGIANPITGTFASNVSFSNLPGGAHIVVNKNNILTAPDGIGGIPVLYDLPSPFVCTPPPPPVFVIDDVNKNEGNAGTTPFTFTITRLGSTVFPTIVQFETRDGSATVANNDYQSLTGNLNFGPNETSKTLTVLVNGDTTIEPNESFTVHILTNPIIGTAQDADGTGLILNDDFPTPVPTPTPTPPNRFEGDINRTTLGSGGTGDGDVNVADQIQYLKFLKGTDCPSTNELPRLDAGPRATLGDGSFGAADGAAIDAYARHDNSTDFNPNTPGWDPTPAGGPTTINNLGCTPSAAPESDDVSSGAPVEPASASAARVVRVVSRSGARNSDITVDIEMTAQGNEAGTQYGLHFDPTVLSISSISGVNTNPDVMLGAGAPEGTALNVNADDAAGGNIGIVENFSAAAITALPEGATRIARVRFHVLDGASSGTSRVDFDNSVISGVTSDVNGMVLSANYEGGDVSVSASRGVTVSGRVTSSDGRGIRGATVMLVDGDGLTKTATTSSFGYYTFDDVAAATYTVGVSSRQYRFGSRTLTVGDNLANVDFTGLE